MAEIAEPYEFTYECAKCKAKIPASAPVNTYPQPKTNRKGNEYTFECPDGCPSGVT